MIPLEFVFYVALVAFELADQLGREKIDDLTALYFPHLADKVFIIFLYSNSGIVVERVYGCFNPPLAVLVVHQF